MKCPRPVTSVGPRVTDFTLIPRGARQPTNQVPGTASPPVWNLQDPQKESHRGVGNLDPPQTRKERSCQPHFASTRFNSSPRPPPKKTHTHTHKKKKHTLQSMPGCGYHLEATKDQPHPPAEGHGRRRHGRGPASAGAKPQRNFLPPRADARARGKGQAAGGPGGVGKGGGRGGWGRGEGGREGRGKGQDWASEFLECF